MICVTLPVLLMVHFLQQKNQLYRKQWYFLMWGFGANSMIKKESYLWVTYLCLCIVLIALTAVSLLYLWLPSASLLSAASFLLIWPFKFVVYHSLRENTKQKKKKKLNASRQYFRSDYYHDRLMAVLWVD